MKYLRKFNENVLKHSVKNEKIFCEKCGWKWETKDSEDFDKYVCHKCGNDNSIHKK